MNNLTVEQKMEYLRKALEMGASIDIRFHHVEEETEALEIANSFSKLAEVPFTEEHSGVFNWFKINGPIPTAVFFDKSYMEEDVDLGGMESA
jgi:hypothetical protein